MKKFAGFIILLTGLSFFACTKQLMNPPAEGFNFSESDEKAIAIADEVMKAMGGRKAWDETKIISWNFFDVRKHYWDKQRGNIRIESIKDDYTLLMNIHTMEGKVKRNGALINEPDSLMKYLEMGKAAWINDAYWLVMPFKLKDSGVTLKYKGTGKTEKGVISDILELTFNGVGLTPDNKYEVYVDQQTKLVNQWAFYNSYEDTEPKFVTAWDGYEKYGKILLAGGRSKYEITEIAVFEEADEKLFTEF